MIKKILGGFIFLVLSASQSLSADTVNGKTAFQHEYTFQAGPFYSGNDLVTTFQSTASLAFDTLSYPIERIESPFLKISSRVLNTAFQGTVGSWLFITMPHEFNHILRSYEYGNNTARPHFPDFMDGHYTIETNYGSMTATERMSIAGAGMEYSHLQAEKYIEEGYRSAMPSYGWGYIMGAKAIDGVNYLYRCIGFLDDPESWLDERRPSDPSRPSPLKYDLLAYTFSLAENYGYFDWIPETALWPYEPEDLTDYVNDFTIDQLNRMKVAYLQTLLDPALFTGLIGLWNYIVHGEQAYKLPMLRINKLYFMPSVEAYMGHKGIENHYRMYYRINRFSGNIYFRYGGNLKENIYGGGLLLQPVTLYKSLSIGGRIDFWSGRGFSFELGPEINIRTSNKLGLKAGFKTTGSLPGYSWQKGLTLSINYTRQISWK